MSYAINTDVPVERSQAEIRTTLNRYGAGGFAYGEMGDRSMVAFEFNSRRVRFVLPMPDKNSDHIRLIVKGGRAEAKASVQKSRHEKACRQRWRALSLAIKAKLECVQSGITTFEEEFMAHIVLPNGSTVGEAMIPQIEAAYKNGKMPPLLGYSS